MTVPTWHVAYTYDGGAGYIRVSAPDSKTAVAIGMTSAEATWNPGKPCRFSHVYRVMRHDELAALPFRGLEQVVEFTYDRRDRGHPYLVIERGRIRDERGFDIWTTRGRLLDSVREPQRAPGQRRI